MPIIRARYPKDWASIALRIKPEANWCCQQCQRPCRQLSESLADFLQRVKQWRQGKSPRPAKFGAALRRYLLTVAHFDQQPSSQDPNSFSVYRPYILVNSAETYEQLMANYQPPPSSETVRIQRILLRDVAAITAVAFFIAGILIALFAAAIFLTIPTVNTIQLRGAVSLEFSGSLDMGLLLLYPFLNAAVGAVGCTLAAGLYNLIAYRSSGIRILIRRD